MIEGDLRERTRQRSYDAIVIGSGPNGFGAAIALAQQRLSVLVVEARPTPGGGTRSAELTLPGFVHDVCSAIHPTALLSPFFRTLPLQQHGLEWNFPEAPLAHPLDDGSAAVLEQSLAGMERGVGDDASAWRKLYGPLLEDHQALFHEILGPLRPPRSPLLLARFGFSAMRSAAALARARFRGPRAQALFAGCAAHSFLALEEPFSAAFGLVLALGGHAVNWPCARGGSGAIAAALASLFKSLGGELLCDARITSLAQLPPARAILFDTAPAALSRIAGEALPSGYRKRLERFRHGPGVFKLDWALAGPIPWKAKECARAGTVHLGGSLADLRTSERALSEGRLAERPFTLLAQQSLFDQGRAPPGKHTGWAYCHVPAGCQEDRTAAIEAQVERFAPGFRELILARATRGPRALEEDNENYRGGDIAGGANDWAQLFTRPVLRASPFTTPNPSLYLCSSSTPPGGGVHGMSGYWAATTAMKRIFRAR